MSFDRSATVDETADSRQPTDRPVAPQSDASRPGESTDSQLPTDQERVEAHRRARITAGEAYAAWHGTAERQRTTTSPPPGATRPDHEAADIDGGHTKHGQAADSASPDRKELRSRIAELEADKADRDKQLTAQDAKILEQSKTIAELESSNAAQDKRIARLEADLGRVTASVSELRGRHDEQQPSAELADWARGGQADRGERPEAPHERRLPSDAVNNVISLVAGGTITELAYHIRNLPPEYAGIGASGLAISAGIVAVWREHRKAKDDADHRPQG
jgi:uncharacterized coiled-coil protein SlyX